MDVSESEKSFNVSNQEEQITESDFNVQIQRRTMSESANPDANSERKTISLSVTIGLDPLKNEPRADYEHIYGSNYKSIYNVPEGADAQYMEIQEYDENGNPREYPTNSFPLNSMPTPDISQYNRHAQGSEAGKEQNSGFSQQSAKRKSTMSNLKRILKPMSKVYKKMDELAEADKDHGGLNTKALYSRSKMKSSRYLKQYKASDESDEARSYKITPEARGHIAHMHALMAEMFTMLEKENDLIPKRDFNLCNTIVENMQDFQNSLTKLINSLRYGPYKNDLEDINDRMMTMIEELQIQPPFVLLRLVEWGFNLFELGEKLREHFIPSKFSSVIHLIQTRVYRLQTGRVIRQIFYVHDNFDPVVGTYFKSRRLIRIENFCNCSIVLLPPNDPRCDFCPVNHRTIEVNFDFKTGRYLGFCNLLNQCATTKIYVAKLAATIFRRLSGVEVDLAPNEMYELETEEARITHGDMKSDLVQGTGTAIAPHINIV